jgi:hypothetical protein
MSYYDFLGVDQPASPSDGDDEMYEDRCGRTAISKLISKITLPSFHPFKAPSFSTPRRCSFQAVDLSEREQRDVGGQVLRQYAQRPEARRPRPMG